MSYLDIARGAKQPAETGAYRAYRAPYETTLAPMADTQETSRTCAVSARSAVSSECVYLLLDEAIAEDEARKYTRDGIAARACRLEAACALPHATPLDHVVADDWRRILAAKDGGRSPP